MNNKKTEELLKTRLHEIYNDEKEVLKILSFLSTDQNKKEMLEFVVNMKICRPSQVEAMAFLLIKEKTENDKLLIKKLFEIWYNSEFVLGCYVPLNEKEKEYITKYIENNKGLPKDELIDRIMYLVIKFRKKL